MQMVSFQGWIAAAALALVVSQTQAQTTPPTAPPLAPIAAPTVQTLEGTVSELGRAGDFDIADTKAVFGFVLASLPERVTVYPTENYYYFSFHHRGVNYRGNIRLENGTRDRGQIHFAYQAELNAWSPDAPLHHALLGQADGLTVERLGALSYRLAFAAKSVVFNLNDLSAVTMPAAITAPDETFIGPVFDESAIRFFLVYNTKQKVFHYVLDETRPVADELVATKMTDRIVIGRRTGFAFYRDHRLERKILIGVFDDNVAVNNFFDGPFDQLPDNFIQGETLRDAIIAVAPQMKGKIDRYGSFDGGAARYAIAPYVQYYREDDLRFMHLCATSKKTPPERYYRCFSVEQAMGKLAESQGRRKR